MANLFYSVEGFEEVSKKLTKLPDKLKKRKVMQILRDASRPMVKGVKNEAPIIESGRSMWIKDVGKTIDPRSLKKSIGFIAAKRTKNPVGYIGPRTGKRTKNDGFMGFWIVRGSINHSPDDFITRGAMPFKNSVQANIEKSVEKIILREAKKMGFIVK